MQRYKGPQRFAEKRPEFESNSLTEFLEIYRPNPADLYFAALRDSLYLCVKKTASSCTGLFSVSRWSKSLSDAKKRGSSSTSESACTTLYYAVVLVLRSCETPASQWISHQTG